jgi:hypothetical protein
MLPAVTSELCPNANPHCTARITDPRRQLRIIAERIPMRSTNEPSPGTRPILWRRPLFDGGVAVETSFSDRTKAVFEATKSNPPPASSQYHTHLYSRYNMYYLSMQLRRLSSMQCRGFDEAIQQANVNPARAAARGGRHCRNSDFSIWCHTTNHNIKGYKNRGGNLQAGPESRVVIAVQACSDGQLVCS